MWDVVSFILQPGIHCMVSGIGIALIPLFWRARARTVDSFPLGSLVAVRWFARGIGVVFVALGFWLAKSTVPLGAYRAAPLILVGSAGVALADILARLAVGPSAMNLQSAELRRLWRGTTSVALLLIIGGAVVHRAWLQVQ
jgi:hypothetical protein